MSHLNQPCTPSSLTIANRVWAMLLLVIRPVCMQQLHSSGFALPETSVCLLETKFVFYTRKAAWRDVVVTRCT